MERQSNIRELYLEYKINRNQCLTWENYFQLARRAYLNENFAEALWAVEQALSHLSISQKLSHIKLKVLKGSIFRAMGRTEESISILREFISFNKDIHSKEIHKERQKAHLQLIHAYYDKTGTTQSRDVAYLLNLFKNYYPDSEYLSLIMEWKKKNQ